MIMKDYRNKALWAGMKTATLACALVLGLLGTSCGKDDPDDGGKKVIPVEKVTVDQPDFSFTNTSEERVINLHFTPAGATVKKLTVSSSDETVATAKGRLYNKADATKSGASTRAGGVASEAYDSAEIIITPVGEGSTNIIVNADGQQVDFTVNIVKDKIAATDVTFEKELFELTVSADTTKTVAIFSPEGATVESLTVISSDSTKVAVHGRLYNKTEHNKAGYNAAEISIIPKAAGEVTVTVTADAVTKTFKVKALSPVYITTEATKSGTVKFNKATASIYVHASRIDFDVYDKYSTFGGIVYSSVSKKPEYDAADCYHIGTDFDIKMNDGLNEGSYELQMYSLTGNTTYYYRGYLLFYTVEGQEIYYGDVMTFTTSEEPPISTSQVVDLGLSVKWAGWNIGAAKPEDIGGYYAWGETTAKTSYSRSNWTSTTEITTANDAATVNWGSNWRMPTLAEMNELKYECDWVSKTYNGVRGYMVVGKNNNAIFIPYSGMWAAGYTELQAADDCPLWTSTPSTAYTNKASLLWFTFKSSGLGVPLGYTNDIVADCWTGCNIRAVHVGE